MVSEGQCLLVELRVAKVEQVEAIHEETFILLNHGREEESGVILLNR